MAGRAAARLLLGLCPLPLRGVAAQVRGSFRLDQPQGEVSVAAGGTLTLTCTTTTEGPTGPVKWLKGWGSENKTIYEQTGSFPRVTRVVEHSNTDFSIRIGDVQPEDADTYYCVKFSRSVKGVEIFAHGKGTVVSLYEKTQLPSMVVTAAVLCFLLLLLGLFVAVWVYWRKRRGEAGSQCLARPVAMGSSLPTPLRCCAGTPGTPSEVLDAETSHLPSQQGSKEDSTIHYADLQPLPAAPRPHRSPGTACSEYASVRVAAK